MTEETLFSSETRATRDEIASFMDGVAEDLAYGSGITLTSEADSITISPPPEVDFEVTVEREKPTDGPAELELELGLEWDENTGKLHLEKE